MRFNKQPDGSFKHEEIKDMNINPMPAISKTEHELLVEIHTRLFEVFPTQPSASGKERKLPVTDLNKDVLKVHFDDLKAAIENTADDKAT